MNANRKLAAARPTESQKRSLPNTLHYSPTELFRAALTLESRRRG